MLFFPIAPQDIQWGNDKFNPANSHQDHPKRLRWTMPADFDNEKNIMAHLEEETKQASIRKFVYSLWRSPRRKFAFLQTVTNVWFRNQALCCIFAHGILFSFFKEGKNYSLQEMTRCLLKHISHFWLQLPFNGLAQLHAPICFLFFIKGSSIICTHPIAFMPGSDTHSLAYDSSHR